MLLEDWNQEEYVEVAREEAWAEGYIIGCLLGSILRRKFGVKSESEIGSKYYIELGRQEEKIIIAQKMLVMEDTPLNIHEMTGLSMDEIDYLIKMNSLSLDEILTFKKKK
jgi:hypothetical protein